MNRLSPEFLNPMTFSDHLRSERTRLGYTHQQLASALGLPFRTYWDYQLGKVVPSEIAQEGALARLNLLRAQQETVTFNSTPILL